MSVLHTQLRNRLETAVKQARRTAEAAAKVAVERLTVGCAEPGTHLSVDERLLRNRLRAHGRQLGDGRDAKTGTQSINRLIHECAYEHWHSMLFARFLAENHLLIHEKEGMAVTLAECDELAGDEGAPDGWTLAARYAARMLPQIFRPDDPVLQVGFAPEHKRALEKLVTELPVEVFTAEDSLGWVYQFWQAERKDEVNASGDKITGETLPAVTQLFTEHYMVLFLLHNTIGAWWATKVINSHKEAQKAQEGEDEKAPAGIIAATEEEARAAVALPGYEFTYLRFIREGETGNSHKEAQKAQEGEGKVLFESFVPFCGKSGSWRPAAGSFPGWPKSLKDFKLLDPCCGSGHFLVAAFVLLVLLRMRDEKLSARDACDAVLRENLHGLELDPRCTQIAAFALALTAWKFPNLPAPAADPKSEIVNHNSEIPIGFRPLPPLNIACSGLGVNARKEDWLALANGDTRLRSGLEQLYDLFQKAPELGSLINPRRLAYGDLVTASFAEIQPLLTKALQSEKAKRNDDLNEIGVAAQGMAQAADLLGREFHLVVTNVPYLARGKHGNELADYCELAHPRGKSDLATCFVERCIGFCSSGSSAFLVSPQNWLFLSAYKNLRRHLLENEQWNFVVKLGPRAFETIGGEVVNVALLGLRRDTPRQGMEVNGLDVADEETARDKAVALWNNPLIRIEQREQLANPDARVVLARLGQGALLSKLAEASHGQGSFDSARFTFNFWELPSITNGWVPQQSTPSRTQYFDGCHFVFRWEDGEGELAKMMEAKKEHGYSSGKWKAGVAAWGKHGLLVGQMSDLPCTLYMGAAFDENASVVIPHDPGHLSALWAYCTSEDFRVALRDIDQSIKITCKTLVKVPFDLVRWQRVATEKYPNGLPGPDSNDPTQWLFAGHPVDSTAPLQVGVARLLGYRWPRQTGQTVSGAPPVPDDGLEQFVDEDGIVCIPSVRGEPPAAERLRALLAAAYGKAWSPGKLDELLSAVDYAGSNLEDWLRNGFFDQHSKLFHHRPFIWQIWDGRKDGFSALVNYHKFDHKLLEKLTYTYLGDWIKKQQDAVANEESGADDRLLKARLLQDKLKLILEGEAPYDIFVRWKPLEQQPIGWHPDLNDGVRLNIRPFMEADVLRKRPNIKWGKDRGKNPPGSPWDEERDNDRHLTLAEKREARKTK